MRDKVGKAACGTFFCPFYDGRTDETGLLLRVAVDVCLAGRTRRGEAAEGQRAGVAGRFCCECALSGCCADGVVANGSVKEPCRLTTATRAESRGSAGQTRREDLTAN